jgi:gliding motility-associated-like protein
MMRILLLWMNLLLVGVSLNAQIEPPELLCVRDDSIFWNPPVNPCGPFIGYEIYYSNSGVQGPYSLLTTVTDPTASSYFHNNQTSEIRHYYMRSVFDCPGQNAFSSDTISNQLPIALPILGASVNSFFSGPAPDGVTLTWPPSPSPETIGYIIYRNTPQGTIPIDTVFDVQIWSSENIDATSSSQTFYVLALDACGNVSLFGDPHTTMVLDYSISVCNQSVTLSWSPYIGWADGVESYDIWISENGSPPFLTASISGAQTSFTLPGLTDQVDYQIAVRANQSAGSGEAYSSIVSFSTEIVQPIRQLEVFEITVTPENRPEISWRWNTNAELTSAIIWGYFENDPVAFAITDYPAGYPLDTDPTLEINWPANEEKSAFYIETTDNCDSVVQSEVVSPIFLTVTAAGTLTNQLSWEHLTLPGAQFLGYDIFRVDPAGNASQLIGTVNASTTNFTDQIDPQVQASGSVCYLVSARGQFQFLKDQTEIPFTSESNRACAQQEALMYVPNAFAPDGRNTRFRPVPVFGASITNYQLSVFNRWGTEVYRTTDLNTGWDGDYKGQKQPAGIYTYRISLLRPSGEPYEEKGTVLLIR